MITGGVFNIGANSQNYQKIQVAELIKKHFPQTKFETNESVDSRDYKVSFDKVARVLGFEVTKDLEGGIIEMKEVLERGVIPSPYDPRY